MVGGRWGGKKQVPFDFAQGRLSTSASIPSEGIMAHPQAGGDAPFPIVTVFGSDRAAQTPFLVCA